MNPPKTMPAAPAARIRPSRAAGTLKCTEHEFWELDTDEANDVRFMIFSGDARRHLPFGAVVNFLLSPQKSSRTVGLLAIFRKQGFVTYPCFRPSMVSGLTKADLFRRELIAARRL